MPNLVPRQGKVNKQGNAFQRGFVGNFTGESHALGVTLNINDSGVGTTTPFPNVSNLIPKHQQEILEPDQLMVQTMSLPTAVLPTEALPAPVKTKSLEVYSTDYQEVSRKQLLAGFLHVCRLHFQGPLEGSRVYNLVSASEFSDTIDRRLAKEIQVGRMIGPFEKTQFHNLKMSPLGAFLKKVQGEYGMIHHLLIPFGDSVNDFIPPEFCSVPYATVDNAVQIIKRLVRGCALSKTDVRSAFCIIPVHPFRLPVSGQAMEKKILCRSQPPNGIHLFM